MTVGVKCAHVCSAEGDEGVLLYRDGSLVTFSLTTGLVIGEDGIFTTAKESKIPQVGDYIIFEELAQGKALRWGFPVSEGVL